MLHSIDNNGTITWYCQAREDQDEPPCNMLNTCSLDEVVYREAERSKRTGRGAAMALPACECGAITYLKADYTMKELYKSTIKYEEEGICVHALPFRYVYNLFVHHKLHERGKAAYAPVLDMPPQELLNHPSFEGVKPNIIGALWFGYSAVREIAPRELEQGNTLQLLPAPEGASYV